MHPRATPNFLSIQLPHTRHRDAKPRPFGVCTAATSDDSPRISEPQGFPARELGSRPPRVIAPKRLARYHFVIVALQYVGESLVIPSWLALSSRNRHHVL